MRVDVAWTPAALPGAPLEAWTAIVVDVLRASTTITTALVNGCAAIVPATDADEARRRAEADGGALVAGERRGEPLAGFDLGNSPLEFTAARVAGRTIVFTTSNGTRALVAVRGAADVAVAGFVNLSAAARWAVAAGRDVLIVCAGERGARSLEDEVCAGHLVDRIAAQRPDASLTEAARSARAAAAAYAGQVGRLARDASWAVHLASRGRAGDVEACLAVDSLDAVPVYAADIDKVVLGPR